MGRSLHGWRSGADIRTIYQVGEDDLNRVGHCWVRGRLKIGDLILCTEHSGDCFYDYLLLDVSDYSNRPGLSLKAIPTPFGAYNLGRPVMELSRQEFFRLQAGDQIETNHKIAPPALRLMRLDRTEPELFL